METYSIAKLVQMLFVVQKHDLENDCLPFLVQAFENTLGWAKIEDVQKAVKAFALRNSHMPTPHEIAMHMWMDGCPIAMQ